VGRGVVLYAAKSPAALTHDKAGADTVRQLANEAAGSIHLPWKETGSLVLRRGPFVIAAGLDSSVAKPLPLYGTFIDLFDPHLALVADPSIQAGDRALLLDPSFFTSGKPRILAASARITDFSASASRITFSVSSIEGRTPDDLTAIRLLAPKAPSGVTVAEQPLNSDAIQYADGMLLLEFPAHASEQKISITF
jgi:hypothetical protein